MNLYVHRKFQLCLLDPEERNDASYVQYICTQKYSFNQLKVIFVQSFVENSSANL